MRRIQYIKVVSMMCMDAVFTLLAMLLAYYIRLHHYMTVGLREPLLMPFGEYFEFAIIISIAIVGLLLLQNRYSFSREETLPKELQGLFWSYTSSYIIVLTAFFFIRYFFFSRFIFLAGWLVGLVFIASGRLIIRAFMLYLYSIGYGRERVLLVGNTVYMQSLESFLRVHPKYNIIQKASSIDIANIEDIIRKRGISMLIIAVDSTQNSALEALTHLSYRTHTNLVYIPDALSLSLAGYQMYAFGTIPALSLHAHRLSGAQYLLKNIMDKIGAFMGIILLSPLFIWLYYRVYKDCKDAPVVYKSRRLGKEGKEFDCYKFRSMIPNADNMRDEMKKKGNDRGDNILYKWANDPRITPFGAFIRRTSLDELPQLFNVLKGDMSLIGPRPHVLDEVEMYHPDDHKLLSIKPGMTGYSAIQGRSEVSFENEKRYEYYYLQNWSIYLDIFILYKTIVLVLTKRNVKG